MKFFKPSLKYFFLALIFFVAKNLSAQKIQENKLMSSYKYILRLDSAQLRFLIQKNNLDTAWIFNSVVDSFLRDSNFNFEKLPYGTYLICHVLDHQIYFNSYHRHPFGLDIWGVNSKNYILVKDPQGKMIDDAKVSLLDGRICHFSVGMASYELPKLPNGTLVKIEYGGSFDYMTINPTYYNPPKVANHYADYSHSSIMPGYIALNQPKYKQNDTLKFKAFLVNDNGSYFYERISVYLSNDYDSREKLIGKYKCKTASAYTGQFVLGDTLTPDRNYNLIFKNDRNEEIKRIGFNIENYELKKNIYELSMASALVYPGQKIVVIAKARDANNLPVMDGYVKFNVRLNSVALVHTNQFFVPNKWYQSIYIFEKELDPSGYTTLELPDTLMAHFDGQFIVEASFTNEDHELITRSTSFQYQNKNRTYAIALQQDSVCANYFYQSKPALAKLRLVSVYSNYTRQSINIQTPFIQKIDYAAIMYELYANDTMVAQFNCPDIQSVISVGGKRTCDSVFISLYNPLRIPVHYEIYKNKKKVAEGKSEFLDYKVADASTESYYIIWGHNYKGALRNNYRTQAFHFQEKKLNVIIDQPEEIYPGQTVNVNIKLTDAKNRPADNINLTSYCVNTQFGEIPLPDVPYMGLIRNDEPLHFTSPNFQVYNCATNLPLRNFQVNALHLKRNDWYALVYSTQAHTQLVFKTTNKAPEFAVYAFRQNVLQTVISIIIDHQIVYHSRNSFPQQYSFSTYPGKHHLQVRTNDELVNMGEFEMQDSTKYILGLNLDSVSKKDTTRMPFGMFSAQEYTQYLNQTLLIHIDEGFDTIKIYQGGQLCFFGNHISTFKQVVIDKDVFYALSVPDKGELRIKLNGLYEHEINFEPNKIYYMNKNEVRSFALNSKTNSALLYFDNTTNPNYNTYTFQQIVIHPERVIIDTSASIGFIAKEKKQRPRPYIYYRDYQPPSNNNRNTLVLYQKHENVPYKRAWLISKTNESKSHIIAYNSYINYSDSGTYDLMLLNDTAMCIVKDLYLPADGTFHLFLFANQIQESDPDQTFEYELMVKRLTKIPLRIFTDSPVSIRPQLMKQIRTRNSVSTISGTVEDALYHTPLNYVTIIAEINGVYKGGALTNEDGDFAINFLPPGNYMLKVRVEGYRYQVIYNLNLDRGIDQVIKVRLLHQEDSIRYGEGGVAEYADADEARMEVSMGEGGTQRSERETRTKRIRSNNSSKDIEGVDQQSSYSYSNAPVMMATAAGATSYQWSSQEVVAVSSEYLNNGVLDPSAPIEKINADKMQQRLNEMAQEMAANRVRDVFRDYGYWVPNILTNKQGIANFTVQFPDNITSWKTMVPAMNGNRQSGLTTMITRSYKPLIGAMAVPNFMVAGDQLLLKGKVINYTGNLQPVKINFTLNQILQRTFMASVDRLKVDTFTIHALKAFDTLTTSFSIKMENGYADGEERVIPVKPKGILISRSTYLPMIADTQVQYVVPEEMSKAVVYVHNSEIEQLRQEIEELKNYSYGCTEQTTSKLRALLAEKSIQKVLNNPFTGDKQIHQLMKRLEMMRNNKGTWGWWEDGYEDYWITMYVVKTLHEARLAGYSNNVYLRAANRMESELPTMDLNRQLEAMNLLKEMDRKLPYELFLKKMDTMNLELHQKLLYVRLMQKLNRPYHIGDVVSLSSTLPGGALYWGTNVYNYQYDQASNTLLAFEILSQDSLGRSLLPNVKKYFSSDNFTRHTLARASLITLYLNDWTTHHHKDSAMFGKVVINGKTLATNEYPFTRVYHAHDTIRILHQGQESFVNIITQQIEEKPQPDETYFKIKSTLNQKHDSVIVTSGQITTLEVTVEAFKTAENVMLEIPLPAGFSYYAKPQQSYSIESHREYYNDRTAIFCTIMPRGKYIFIIQVVPKFTGLFNLPPAKIELMYYPEIRNNEVPKMIEVK